MTSSTGTVVFNDAKLQAVDVVATERLGVGTLDPASNLHVVGNVHVTGNVNKLNFTDGYSIKRGANVTVFGTTDVIQEITGPHARHVVPLRKYPEVTMTTSQDVTTLTYGGYTASASNDRGSSYRPWKAFDGLREDAGGWGTGNYYDVSTGAAKNTSTLFEGNYGEYLELQLPVAIKLVKAVIKPRDVNATKVPEDAPGSGYIYASNDGSDWTLLHSFSGLSYGGAGSDGNASNETLHVNASHAYKYYRLQATSRSGQNGSDQYINIAELEYYGYEETSDPDTSVDTTITSQFNLPDTTGVKLYIDGDKGSTPTDYSGEGHTLTDNSESFSGNAWSFSSLSTSNVTMTSGDFAMEGTHPHSVSLWFNAANVSSNATLFHVGTAAGEGDAKTAISLTETGHLGWIDGGDNQFLSSNTWHNLVYATQGGGGLRTCYLDGRKLGDVSDQDTFGDYPPFAMSTYSQGGYTVSVSSDLTGYDAWEAFDDILGNATNTWISEGGRYSSGTYTGSQSTTVSGTPYVGEWIQLELPFKLNVSHVLIAGQHDALPRSPQSGAIAGSNDGTTWYLLNAFSSITGWASQVYKTFITNTTSAYKYFRVIATSIQSTDTTGYVALQNIRLMGHKENDTTRFPVSSTVLKYPHIAMTGYAQRGYVVSASSVWSGYNPWEAFDENNPVGGNTGAGAGWASSGPSTSYDTYNGSTGEDLGITSHHTGSVTGEWIQIELPTSIILSSIDIESRSETSYNANGYDHGYPKDVVLYGSSDGSSWSTVKSFTTVDKTASEKHTEAITSSTAYKYYALIVESIHVTSSTTVVWCSIGQLRLYGTEPEDVIARVGEGLDGKVANFRVYDKYLHEEQALELWDAQKDQFGRATSSVVVHKGRLGVGTTEPEGRFAVLDEAHESEEFPPRAMTDYETYMDGHGVFKVRASSTWSNNQYLAFGAFNKTFLSGTPNLTWNSVFDGFSSGSDYAYIGTNSLGGISGEWLKLSTPHAINPSRIRITVSSSYISSYAPEDFYLLGSMDDANWYVLSQKSGETWSSLSHNATLNTTDTYKYFALVVTKTRGATNTNVTEMQVFGTRERGQSTLHDGELKLTKNLTVPRIGPPLDADDTPRRDKLVVEYNTSTNPTENGMVRDTSGIGLDGRMYNDAYYDATEKALVFDGTGDYVSMSDWKYDTGFVHSFSGWIKFKLPEESWNVVYGVGNTAGTSRTNFTIWSKTDDSYFRTEADGSGSYIDHTFEFTGNMDKWLHMAVVKSSARIDSTRIYINGVLLPQTNATLADRELALPSTPQNFNLNGYGPDGGVGVGNVNLSNVKFYDVALTATEVKRLYDMGRYDEGHHVVNFSKTRVGIGLGDGEAPTYTLDVRGQIRSQGSLVTSFTGQHKCVPENGEPIEKGLVVSAKKNKFVKLNGLATGKNAITIDESLPVVSLSNVAQDKACFGVVSGTEEANTIYRIETTNGGLISQIPKTLGDNRVIVNSVGEGAIWVCDANGPLESGDYITTSNVAGYGQKQEGAGLMNYTVAKITMDCDFTASNVAVQAIKKIETLKTVTEDVWEGLSVYDRDETSETQYSNTVSPEAYSNLVVDAQVGYVAQTLTTIVDYMDGSNVISVSEWSNLESNVQHTYTSNTLTEIVDYTKFIDVGEWSNLEAVVQNTYSEAEVFTYYRIQRGENVLDEHGMLQWEDTGLTEPGYEMRYLDASGQQTDEANCVHRAAFVGCTYHCG